MHMEGGILLSAFNYQKMYKILDSKEDLPAKLVSWVESKELDIDCKVSRYALNRTLRSKEVESKFRLWYS